MTREGRSKGKKIVIEKRLWWQKQESEFHASQGDMGPCLKTKHKSKNPRHP